MLFENNSALANQRRVHRQQRRHIRATRQRIQRLEKLLAHIGALSQERLLQKHAAAGGHSAPWLRAARVLASNGTQLLTWSELWDVLRWYAHNRGYDATGGDEMETNVEDTEKVENAKREMARFGKETMAETICAWLGLDPLGGKTASLDNYKGRNCAFERTAVRDEVRRILVAHCNKLTGLDDKVIAAITDDARALAIPGIHLPLRYRGSLLFGRLATRYHNRIIGHCPISGDKLPSKCCPEFLRYRWAMQLANIRVVPANNGGARPLTVAERTTIHACMVADGYLTPGKLKRAVASLPGIASYNLDQLLLHPDAAEALVYDPVQKLITSNTSLAAVWPHLPERLRKRAHGRLRRRKSITLGSLRAEAKALGDDLSQFDATIDTLCTLPPARRRNGRKDVIPNRQELLSSPIDARRELAKLSGRAPYSRPLLVRAFEEVMRGDDPKACFGCLEETAEVRQRRESRPLPQQTNNHLIRHRLQILGRLLDHLLADPEYAAGDLSRVIRVTLEVNRDLREMAGLTAEDIAKALGARLANHKNVSKRLEAELPAGTVLSAGLIRKARIADDLNWRCPYTGAEFEPIDLVERRADRDHIIPRSQRMTDSLDALVVTFSAVNKWKGQRTAWQFILEHGGMAVPDAPHLSIMTPARFKDFVQKLGTKGHVDDSRRKKRRKEFLLLERYEERSGGFTPGQLTQTSQLSRLAAQVVRAPFEGLPEEQRPTVVALPGSVTGTVRRGWNLLGCLAAAAPGVLEADGSTKTKTEIREITHLHHALDACVIGLAAELIPNRGDIWQALAERKLKPEQRQQLASLGVFDFDAQNRFRLRDLPEGVKQQVRARLAERRVVRHVPADMSGIQVQENTRGVLRHEDGRVHLRQSNKGTDGRRVTRFTSEAESKVIGLPALGIDGGKLAKIKGVRVITGNYGVAIFENAALAPEDRFAIIPFAKVWQQMAELQRRNGGKRPQVWRNGQTIEVPKGRRAGRWRIFSVKNTSNMGLVLDLGPVHEATASWKNVMLKSLLRDGCKLLVTKLTGTAWSVQHA